MKVSCLAWAPFSDRLDELAAAVGGERKNFDMGYLPKFAAPAKYLVFMIMTLVYLLRERPDVVYAQNPPPFCPLVCIPYCKATGTKLVVDHHNLWYVKGFAGNPIAPYVRAIEATVGRAADANTVPHSVWRDTLASMGGRRVVTVHDYVPRNPYDRSEEVRRPISSRGVIGIASGHQGVPQERVESEARAAEMVTGVTLAITGPPERLGPRVRALGQLRNVKFLGYLPKDGYERLKASCDFGLSVSDEPNTVNHVLFEYAAASLPTISSRRREIEAVFGDSLVYVDSSDPSAVAERIAWLIETPSRLAEYRGRISDRFERLTREREAEIGSLRALIAGRDAPPEGAQAPPVPSPAF